MLSNNKNVLIACEESQAITIEFRKLGFKAFSCDIQPCSGGYPEWHIQDDVLNVIDFKWDLIIAHPPCTYLSAAGAVRQYFKVDGYSYIRCNRLIKGLAAKQFFMKFYELDCPYCIENPRPLNVFKLPKHDQIIDPYLFGDPYYKRTYLWLHKLPKLDPTNIVEPMYHLIPKSHFNYKGCVHGSVLRSKTFPGIAKAIAAQWSACI